MSAIDDVNWEEVARKYQSENENLRLNILKLKKSSFSIDLDFESISRFVENNYLFIIVTLLALSYIGSFFIDLYKARRIA